MISLMANYWVKRGWEINLITFDDGSNPPHYHLDTSVLDTSLGIAGDSSTLQERLINNIKRIHILRRTLTRIKPHAVISFLDTTNIITLLALAGTRIPRIVSERNDPFNTNIGKIWNRLRMLTYLSADAVVVQAIEFEKFFPSMISEKVRVIHNPVLIAKHYPISTGEGIINKPAIVSVGKLHRQKGFDLLIKAFSKIHKKHPEWSVIILGEGECRLELENLRNSLGLENKILFLGKVARPEPYLDQGDIFVLPSRYEGFSNALCEAMACGKAVIATDCPGNREIIRDGKDGLLVPRGSVSALSEAIDTLILDSKKRQMLSSKAADIVNRFGIDKIMAQWSQLLIRVR